MQVLHVLVGFAGIVTTLVGAAASDGRIIGFTREHFLFCSGLLMLFAIWPAVNTVHHFVMLEKTGDAI
ncbi:MAG: hypothetical protein ABI999_00245 [Acidobacteriota bacterium]